MAAYAALKDISPAHTLVWSEFRLVGILHACLEAGQTYSESVAWPQPQEIAA